MQVDFYLLENEESNTKNLFVCKIIEKAYKLRHKVFIHCKNQDDANYLDELLWTYKADSFIPHNLQGEGPEPPPAVQIGYDQEPRGFDDVLINLSNEIPTFYKKFVRVIEIVENIDAAKEISRQHFREYKKQGCKLFTHNIHEKQSNA